MMIINKRFVSRFYFLLLSVILFGCGKELTIRERGQNPVKIFDELWEVMDSRYSMFSYKQVDWKSMYTVYRQQINETTPESELFRIMGKMLETLKDGHIALISQNDTTAYQNFYTSFAANFNYNNLLNNYLGTDYKATGPIVYKILNGVGYIYYDSFRRNITDGELNEIFGYLKETKGLIIDVRNNSGGDLENVNRLFSRFLLERKLLKYSVFKKGKDQNDFLQPVPFYLEPNPASYRNNIVVLTNRKCYSACNDFVLYMSLLPNVRIYGDQTGGGGGLPNYYVLSNGWKIQYSSSITLSPEMINIENGIEPDRYMQITPINETNGFDPILEAAYLALQ